MGRKHPALIHFVVSAFWWITCLVGFYTVLAEKFENLPAVKLTGFMLILIGGILGIVNYNIAREALREPW